MNSGTKILLKGLIGAACYIAFFALAWFAFSDVIMEGSTSNFSWIICIILAIVGFIATASFPYIQFPGIAGVMFTFACRIIFAMFAGVFIAPWKITKKIISLLPGEE